MKIAILILITAMSLQGCISNPQVEAANANVAAAGKQLKAGKIKKSEYWVIYYNEGKSIKDTLAMEVGSYMIDAAMAYEAGKISKEEYESRDRNADTYDIKEKEAIDQQQRRAAAASFAKSMSNVSQAFSPQGSVGSAFVPQRSINCTSTTVGASTYTNCQ